MQDRADLNQGVGEGATEDEVKRYEDLNARVVHYPVFADVTRSFEVMLGKLKSAIAEAHGACLLCGLSILSGLGTDELLSYKGSTGAKGRGKKKARELVEEVVTAQTTSRMGVGSSTSCMLKTPRQDQWSRR